MFCVCLLMSLLVIGLWFGLLAESCWLLTVC